MCSVLFFFLFTLLFPGDAFSFDTDTLKTAGIVSGITIGVALVVVLIVGTVRDLKKDRGEEDEDDDVWSQNPVLRTLGYRPVNDILFARSPAPLEGRSEKGRTGGQEIETFLEGRVDTVRSGRPNGPSAQDPHLFRLSGIPTKSSLSHPAAGRKGQPPPFSLWRVSKEVYRDSGA